MRWQTILEKNVLDFPAWWPRRFTRIGDLRLEASGSAACLMECVTDLVNLEAFDRKRETPVKYVAEEFLSKKSDDPKAQPMF